MGQKSDYGVSGLNTAPSPVVGVPPGSLSTADNCVIRRIGMIEPRPGFGVAATLTLDEIWKLIPYDGSYFAAGLKTAVQKTRWASDTLTDATFDKHYVRAAEARKNLYLTTSDAVRKFTSANDATAQTAGLNTPLGGVPALDTGNAIVNGTSVAYRFTIRRKDENGLIIRSAPSARIILDNDSGGARNAANNYYFGLGLGFAVGDVLEVWRSYGVTTSATPPPDELFFSHEVVLDAGAITDGRLTGDIDSTLDANLGTPLYTNATQEGDKRANVPPPRARDIAVFAGSLFAADIVFPHQLYEQWILSGNVSASATGIGYRSYTGTRTNGSNQITGLSSIVGLKVGQMLQTGASWSGAVPVLITAVAGATATMSQTWGGATDGAPVAIVFVDSIRIKTGSEDQYYPADSVASFLFGLTIGTGSAARAARSLLTTADFEGDASRSNSTGGVYPSFAQVQFRQMLPTTAAFQIWATHGSEYNPVLPEPTVGTGATSAQDTFPNGITWSKQEEPEHFMRGQLRLVGNARAPVLRIVALKDALYILKGRGDGIYRLTGFGELSGWNVQQLDPTTYLLHPELVTVLEDMIYAWTNTGMCKVDASGQQMLSGPILDLTGVQELTLDSGAASHSYAFASANLKDHEVIFGLPLGDVDGTAPANTWVYNTFTNAWTTWFGDSVSPYTMMLDPATRLLRTAGNGATVLAERSPSASIINADLSHAITVSAVSGLAVTIAGGSGWTPLVGDLVVRSSVTTIVTSVTDATHFAVADAVTAGAGTAYEGYYSTIAWLPKLDPTGAAVKRWQSLVTHWDDIYGVYSWTQTVSGPRGNAANMVYTRAFDQRHIRAETRSLLPQSVAMDTQLYPGLLMHNAGSQWRITGMSENYEIATDRVAL